MDTLLWIGILLLVIWAISWIVFQISGFLLHLLLVVGAVAVVVWLVDRARGAGTA